VTDITAKPALARGSTWDVGWTALMLTPVLEVEASEVVPSGIAPKWDSARQGRASAWNKASRPDPEQLRPTSPSRRGFCPVAGSWKLADRASDGVLRVEAAPVLKEGGPIPQGRHRGISATLPAPAPQPDDPVYGEGSGLAVRGSSALEHTVLGERPIQGRPTTQTAEGARVSSPSTPRILSRGAREPEASWRGGPTPAGPEFSSNSRSKPRPKGATPLPWLTVRLAQGLNRLPISKTATAAPVADQPEREPASRCDLGPRVRRGPPSAPPWS